MPAVVVPLPSPPPSCLAQQVTPRLPATGYLPFTIPPTCAYLLPHPHTHHRLPALPSVVRWFNSIPCLTLCGSSTSLPGTEHFTVVITGCESSDLCCSPWFTLHTYGLPVPSCIPCIYSFRSLCWFLHPNLMPCSPFPVPTTTIGLLPPFCGSFRKGNCEPPYTVHTHVTTHTSRYSGSPYPLMVKHAAVSWVNP